MNNPSESSSRSTPTLTFTDQQAETLVSAVKFDANGLVAAIAQDAETGQNLMLAYMNAESLHLTLTSGKAVYWSRSRNKLWQKGESSGHVQWLESIHLDCDADCILMQVEQVGGIACHTGRAHCYFRAASAGESDVSAEWAVTEPVKKSSEEIYGQ